ncbi:MAG: inner membrane CreD family protein [Pseudomonadota bacterium]
MGTRSFAVGGTLVALYGVLFLILRSADLALLAGATLAFLALTATVILTRNEDWYGPKRPRRSIWGRTAAPDPATPAP